MNDFDASALAAYPAWLRRPCNLGEGSSHDLAERSARAIGGFGEITAQLAREIVQWVEEDFRAASIWLLTCNDKGVVDEPDRGGDWSQSRRWLATQARDSDAQLGLREETALLLHAALVGLARGASRDAFAYARVRKLSGKPLIDHDLMAARLSAIATHEVIGDLQFRYLCEPEAVRNGEQLIRELENEREGVYSEIQRASLAAVVESAHVHGGHGFVQRHDPGVRVELAHAVLGRLAAQPSSG